MRDLDCSAAHQLMASDHVPYIDVRTPELFAEGHPAGALNVPVAFASGSNPDFVDVVIGLCATDRPVLIGGRSGLRSKQACRMLESAGFADCINVTGGYEGIPKGRFGMGFAGWLELGLPTSDSGEGNYEALLARVPG